MNSWIARTTPLSRRLAGVCLLAILSLVPTGCERKFQAQLEHFGTVEPLEFTNHENQPFSLADLEGKVWVASFVFTSCSIECAFLVKRLQKVHDQLAAEGDLSLVAFSLDPQTDTPQRLKAYAERYCEDTSQWQFLTGDAGKLDRVINNTFLPPNLDVEQEKQTSELDDHIHRNHFAVVDRQGVIRFYVDGLLPEADKLVIDAVRQLYAEPKS